MHVHMCSIIPFVVGLILLLLGLQFNDLGPKLVGALFILLGLVSHMNTLMIIRQDMKRNR